MNKPDDISKGAWDAAVSVTVGTMAFGSPRLTADFARALMAAKADDDLLREALHFITNIDNAHPVVRKLREALA